MFVVSWRNPEGAQGHFDMDTYAQAMLEARDAVAEITEQDAIHVNAACSGGIVSAGAVGHLQASGELSKVASLTLFVCAIDNTRADRCRGPDHARGGGGRRRRVRPQGLSRRAGAGRGLRVAAPQRHGLELRGQQLPAGQGAAGVRHPLLEPGRRPSRGRAASRLRASGARELDGPPRRARGARDADRPRRRRRRQLRRRRPARPHRALGDGVPERPAPGRQQTLRPVDERAHPGAGQPALRRVAVQLPSDGRAPARSAGVRPAGAKSSPAAGGRTTSAWLAERSGDLRPAPTALGSEKHKATSRAPGTYVRAA